MYNLYRAWFGDETATSESYSRAHESLSPPDTVVRVGNEGEHRFVAHRGVLAAHSGYLKALLANAAATSTSIDAQSVREPVMSISVSSIGGEAFALLLNYMYTGHLEVTLDNVYSVLLATHLLHMPGALEQCRAALLRLRGSSPPLLPTPMSIPSSSKILRPIPNRLLVRPPPPPLCWPQTAPIYSPAAPLPVSVALPIARMPQLQPSVLVQAPIPPGIAVVTTQNLHESVERKTSALYSSSTITSRSPKASPSNYHHVRHEETRLSVSRSTTPEMPSLSSSSSRSCSPSRDKKTTVPMTDQSKNNAKNRSNGDIYVTSSHPSTAEETETSRRRRSSNDEASGSPATSDGARGRGSRRRNRSESTSNGVLSVVYDVACCDGPVRFHRVLNENYQSCGSAAAPQRPRVEGESAGSSENDENNGGPRENPRDSNVEGEEEASYACEYCRHTFKSKYCYRKHTKRHLLPTRSNTESGSRPRQSVVPPRNKREVRLLDLNVQYYPCKICGCKFPSYYFVHKHRKLCHAGNEEGQSRNENSDATSTDRGSSETSVREIEQ